VNESDRVTSKWILQTTSAAAAAPATAADDNNKCGTRNTPT